MIVRWWNTNQYDLRTLVAHGFTGVVDGWVTTITTAMEDSDAKADPLDHKLVPELLPSYLEELAAVEARRAELDAQIKAAAATGDEDDEEPADDMEALSPAELAALKKQLTGVKKQQKAMQQEFITKLGKARAELTAAQERDLVLRLAKNDVADPPGRLRHRPPPADHRRLGELVGQVRHPPTSDRSRTRRRYQQARGFLKDLGYE